MKRQHTSRIIANLNKLGQIAITPLLPISITLTIEMNILFEHIKVTSNYRNTTYVLGYLIMKETRGRCCPIPSISCFSPQLLLRFTNFLQSSMNSTALQSKTRSNKTRTKSTVKTLTIDNEAKDNQHNNLHCWQVIVMFLQCTGAVKQMYEQADCSSLNTSRTKIEGDVPRRSLGVQLSNL